MSKIRQALDGGPIYMAGIRKELKAMVNEYDRLKSELDALRKDAERYRWLRDKGDRFAASLCERWMMDAHRVDEVIDDSMHESQE